MSTRLPDPYFPNIPQIGDLTMDYIILDYDYPLLFVCKNEGNQLYLCDCCDTYKEQRWVIAPISRAALIALLTNKLMIRTAFENAKGLCCVAVWSKNHPLEQYKILSSSEFQPEDLPDEGEMLDAEDGEYSEYISILSYAGAQDALLQGRTKSTNIQDFFSGCTRANQEQFWDLAKLNAGAA